MSSMYTSLNAEFLCIMYFIWSVPIRWTGPLDWTTGLILGVLHDLLIIYNRVDCICAHAPLAM